MGIEQAALSAKLSPLPVQHIGKRRHGLLVQLLGGEVREADLWTFRRLSEKSPRSTVVPAKDRHTCGIRTSPRIRAGLRR